MAMSLGVLSSLSVSGESASMSIPSSLRLTPPLVYTPRSNLRTARMVTTSATASKPAAEAQPRGARGIMKPRRVSPEMQAFLGGIPEIPRTQALKKIWQYIKEQNLQDPENRKVIVCDENLKKIFAGKERVGFLEVAGLISPHFLK